MPVELPSQLLSGPDLGGGFLFQLTRERAPLPPGFTFHLQEAGLDAAHPPAASPRLLGFEHPAEPCMYGGRDCWHLPLPLSEGELLPVRVAYNRTRFVLDPMLAQAAHLRPAPIAEGLRELLERIGGPMGDSHVAWQIGGSAGAWLRGARIDPADLDLSVEERGFPLLAEALSEYLVVPPHPIGPAPDAPRRAAAFVGTLQAGIRVEWGSVDPAAGAISEWEGPGWAERRERIPWEGHEVWLAPVEFEAIRLGHRGGGPRWEAVLELAARRPFDGALIEAILGAEPLPPLLAEELRKAAGYAPPTSRTVR